MGLFDTLTSKLFGTAHAKGPDASRNPAPSGEAPSAETDPMVLLRERASKHPEKLDWEHSIVDLMKLVGMDSMLGCADKDGGRIEVLR